jgi:hypothetical protein
MPISNIFPPGLRELFRTTPVTNGLPPRDPANGAPPAATHRNGLDGPPPIGVNQQPARSSTLLRRRAGGANGNGTDDGPANDAPLVVQSKDPHTGATVAQFTLQAISSIAGVLNDMRDGGGKIVDWFMQLLNITGNPR